MDQMTSLVQYQGHGMCVIVPTISELSCERDDRVADGLRVQLVLDRFELMFEL